MKKILIITILLLGVWSASGQHYVGAKAGYGAMKGRFWVNGKPQSDMVWGRYTGGVMWKYYSAQPVVGGVGAELEYQMRGYRIVSEGFRSDTTSYTLRTRTVSSVTLPLIWQPHLYFANRKVRFFASLGFTVSYNTGIGDQLTTFTHTYNEATGTVATSQTTEPYKMQISRDNRWNYGFLGGAGLGILTGRAEFFAEARYYYGMGDILRTKTKYRFNEENSIRSELDNLYITFGVYFRLGKGGIKAPPLRRRAPSTSENDFRNIKISY